MNNDGLLECSMATPRGLPRQQIEPPQAPVRRSWLQVLALIALALTLFMFVAPYPAVAQSATWTVTGNSTAPKLYHTATLLPNGKVLVAGGGGDVMETDLYDPASGSWSSAGTLAVCQYHQTANLLPNGKVLLAGGFDPCASSTVVLNRSQIYDPATGVWSASGNMVQPRTFHASVLLQNGKVLVIGGKNAAGNMSYLNSAEIYDPSTGLWSATGSMANVRGLFDAVVLNNGKVLVAGGFGNGDVNLNSSELYDPATGTWTTVGSLGNATERGLMQKLNDGRVLMAGGHDLLTNCTANAWLFDPGTSVWSPAASMKYARGGYHTLTLMPDGQVLAAGGETGGGYLNSAELYDPMLNVWKYTGWLTVDHVGHTATLLPSGKVLLTAGYTTMAELYGPPVPRTKTDFNADGKSDIVFENGVGTRWLFNMNGAATQSAAPLPAAAPGWVLAGIGDFDGNGDADLLWNNTANPTQYWIYLMAANTIIGGGSVTVAAGYKATFIADFDGDGRADILWENAAGGRWFYFMNGASVSSAHAVLVAAPGWTIAGVGDFNGDGRADLLWLNTGSPTQYWIYLLNGASVIGGGGIVAALAYQPTRIADFNNDGKDDILFENRFHQRWFYFMNGATIASFAPVPEAAADWNIVGVGDFDNNHSADLLWQYAHDPTQYWIYLMTGGGVSGGGSLTVGDGYLPLTR